MFYKIEDNNSDFSNLQLQSIQPINGYGSYVDKRKRVAQPRM